MSKDLTQLVLLSDNPSDKDLFSAGGHDRSATLLVEAIRQFRNEDAAVGLDGGWGAGKSTVIELASQKLESAIGNGAKDYGIYTFDLWAHQSESFRRALLEGLIAWGSSKRRISEEDKNELLDKVQNRRTTTKHKKRRTVTMLALVVVFLTALLPLAISWLSPFAFSPSLCPPTVLYLSPTYWAVMAFFAIPTIIFLNFLRLWGTKRRGLRSSDHVKSEKAREISPWPDAISIFSSDVDVTEVDEHIRESDPTTFEFQKYFREIIATMQRNDFRLVLVLDNIDRISRDKIPEVWAEVRSVFSSTVGGRNLASAPTSITVIVPYDHDLIEQCLTGKMDLNNDIRPTRADVGTPLARELIQKTFNVVVRVSPPLMTDWRMFLEKKLNEAFNDAIGTRDRYRIYRIFEIYCRKSEIMPTPRSIISFINDISVLRVMWGEQIPVAVLATYVVHKEALNRKPRSLADAKPIGDEYLQVTGVDRPIRYLAALVYNVDPDRAAEVLLSQSILKSLTEGNVESFTKLQNSEGFEEVLGTVVEENAQEWVRNQPYALANACKCLGATPLTTAVNDHLWEIIDVQLPFLRDPDQFEGDLRWTDLGQIPVNLHSEDRALSSAETLVAWLEKRHLPEEEPERVRLGRFWCKSVGHLADALGVELGPMVRERFLNEKISVPEDPFFTIGVVLAADEYGVEFDSLQLQCEPSLLRSTVLKSLSSYPEGLSKLLQNSKKTILQDDGEALTSCFQNMLSVARSRPSEKNYEARQNATFDVLSRLWLIASPEVRDNELNPLFSGFVQDGSWYWHLGHSTDQDPSLAANLLFLRVSAIGADFNTNINDTNHPALGDLNDVVAYFKNDFLKNGLSDESLSGISDLIGQAGTFSEWREYARDNDGLFTAIFEELVRRNDYGEVDLEAEVTDYPKTKSFLGERELEHYLSVLTAYSESLDEFFSASNSMEIPNELLHDIHSLKISGLENLAEFRDQYLNSLSASDWTEALSSETALVEALITRTKTKRPPLPPADICPALKSHMIELLRGNVAVHQYVGDWSDVCVVEPHWIDNLAKAAFLSIGEIAITPGGLVHFIECYPQVARALPILDNPHLFINSVFVPLIGSPTPATHNFIADREKDISACLKLAEEQSLSLISDVLRGLESKGDDDLSKWVQTLRRMFKEIGDSPLNSGKVGSESETSNSDSQE